jgi:hypothetical protein
VVAQSADNVWVGGWLERRRSPIFVMHWNATRRSERTTSQSRPNAFLNATTELVTDGKGGVWLGPWVHWTGTTWDSVAPGLSTSAFDLNAFARIPGTVSLWGVGQRRTRDGRQGLVGLHGAAP